MTQGNDGLRRADALKFLTLLSEAAGADAVFEVRIPKAGREKTVSGYFTDPESAVQQIAAYDSKVVGIYVTPNPVNPALLSRAANRLKAYAESTTADPDIVVRKWFLIDLDPVRPSGISSSEAEHEAAVTKARQVRDWLTTQGWPLPVFSDSGNGCHLMYRVNLPNDTTSRGLLQGCLAALDERFGDEGVSIDQTVFNAARIWKIPGTMSMKGDASTERPHRHAQLVEVPESPTVVDRHLLEALAGSKPLSRDPVRETWPAFDLNEWLRANAGHLKLSKRKELPGGGWLMEVTPCPWNPEHKSGEAWVGQHASGAAMAGCHHNSCSSKDWEALRDDLEPGWRERRSWTLGPRPTRLATIEGDPALGCTDLGNARRLVAAHGNDLRYVGTWGRWYIWDGRRWAHDDTGEVIRRASSVSRIIDKEASSENDDTNRRELRKWATRSEMTDRIFAMVQLGRSQAEFATRHDTFDADPMLLNVENGTVDLRTGVLRPHDRQNLITRLAPVAYDPDALCPQWDRFLAEILPSAELRQWVQRAVGYSLSGQTTEQVFFIAHGTGANGKSVFLEIVKAQMGDYSQTAAAETFTSSGKSGDKIPNDLASMVGTRLVAVSETEDGRRLDEALMKRITGGDEIRARFMREEWFSYRPTFKPWLVTNYRPDVRGTDKGIWRRIRLVPFEVTIPEERRDKNLMAKLRTEMRGILAWAVRGAVEWNRDGLGAASEVTGATAAYRQEQDVVAAFLQFASHKPGQWISRQDMRRQFEEWSRSNGDEPMKPKSFNKRLRDKGFREVRQTDSERLHGWVVPADQPSGTVPRNPGNTSMSSTYAVNPISLGPSGTDSWTDSPSRLIEVGDA